MGLPPEAISDIRNPARPELTSADTGGFMSYWLQEPFYMSRWTYLHRPSVWNRMGGSRGLEWHGVYGFKSLMGGSKGIGYAGTPRTAPRIMQWGLRTGGRGMYEIGAGFQNIATAMGARGVPGTVVAPVRSVAMRIGEFGMGFGGLKGSLTGAPGGVAGGLREVGRWRGAGGRSILNRAADYTESVFGGAVTSLGEFGMGGRALGNIMMSPSYRALSAGRVNALASTMDREIGRQISRRAGVTHLLSGTARADLADDILRSLGATYRPAARAGGTALTADVARSIMWKGGARLAAAGTVVANIALFGSILAKLAHAGTRYIGQAAFRAMTNNRGPMLEFGGGVDPFPDPGSLTERRRAIQAIQGSQLNARRFIGNEAALLHE